MDLGGDGRERGGPAPAAAAAVVVGAAVVVVASVKVFTISASKSSGPVISTSTGPLLESAPPSSTSVISHVA
jgi:hypothetical protein